MASYDMNPEGETRDPEQMIRDMKTKAREEKQKEQEMLHFFDQGPLPTRGAKAGEPGSIQPSPVPRMDIPDEPEPPREMGEMSIKPRSLASGVYEGAGGYKYEVMPGGAIKIVDAPKGRGVGVTLKFGHPAHEAIFEELTASDSGPMEGGMREEEDKTLSQMVKESKDRSATAKVTMSPEAKAAFDRVKNR